MTDIKVIKVIKCKLSSILRKDCDKDKIAKLIDCVKRTNTMVLYGSHLIRAYILYKFERNEEFILPSEDLFMSAFKVLSKPSRGAKKKTDTYIELRKFYDNVFKKDVFELSLNSSLLSFILNSEATKLVTAYTNNIVLNFSKYLCQYINEIFNVPRIEKLPKHEWIALSSNAKQELISRNKVIMDKIKCLRKELLNVKIDILYGTSKSDNKYTTWINEFRKSTLPKLTEKTVISDTEKHPLNYLKSLLVMNRCLEVSGKNKKLFQPLPLRTDICTKYVQLDSSFIRLLLGKVYKIPCNKAWDVMFNLKQNKFSINGYVFNDMIMTDGQYVSILLIKNSKYETKQAKHKLMSDASKETRRLSKDDQLKHKQTKQLNNEKIKKDMQTKAKEKYANLSPIEQQAIKQKFKKQTEFKYLEDVIKDNNKLTELKDKLDTNKIIIGDPGKRSPITLSNGETYFEYRRSRRLFETKRLKYNQLRQKKYDELIQSPLITELAKCNSKTMNYKLFVNFIIKKHELLTKLDKNKLRIYSDYCSKLRWYSYVNTKRHEDNLLNEIEDKFGNDCTMIIGDWSNKERIKGISMPSIGIKRLLSKRFEVYLLDEFNTSKMYYTDNKNYQECEHLIINKPQTTQTVKERRKKKQTKLHSKKMKWKQRKRNKQKGIYEDKQVQHTERVKSDPNVPEFDLNHLRNSLRLVREAIRNRFTTKQRMHAVLTYKMSNNRIGCINRDRNATRNMLVIVTEMLNNRERPTAFQRNNSVK